MIMGYGLFKRLLAPLVLGAALVGAALVGAALVGAGAHAAAAAPSPATRESPRLILAFGDSLTAGYGLPAADGFTRQLEDALNRQGLNVRVHNAGVSGDTSSGGRSRLAWVLSSLKQTPDLVILELGANDALRGIDPKVTRDNLDAMLAELKKRNLPVLLAGMYAPRGLGATYYKAFDAIYPELAKKHGVALYPFFLEGVAADPALNQRDGIHPNKAGVAEIVRRITPHVRRAMEGSGARAAR
ncbi:arylesterase [Pedomonas sp. V897]|uniref:arylesterase n=1 Tax=Pedomonas sp. V897 TaxID=3446482 RepID=UPI003EE35842